MATASDNFRLVYVTTKDKDQANDIAEALVKERLVACANILPGMESVYQWEGQVCREQETVLIAKTTSDLIHLLIERVKQIHSYSVPCIISLPILEGNPDFLQWIIDETKKTPV